jgi:polar amino acid transport system substrate-binding protein
MKFTILIAILFFTQVSFAHARTFSEIKKSGTLEIATEGAFPPFNFVRDGKISGFEIDLVNEMAKRLELKTKWRTVKFDDLLMGLFEDHYDLVAASHAKTAGRENAVDFLPPHYCSGGVIVSLKGGPKKLTELQGKHVGVQLGSIYTGFLDKHANAKTVTQYSTDPATLDAVLKRHVDAGLTDRFLLKQFVKSHPELQAGEIVNPEEDAMAVKKGNTTLLRKLKGVLEAMLKDGTYAAISHDYFGEDIRCKN